MSQTKFENNLVKGSVVKQLLMFAIPFIISNLIQSLYSISDMIIIGQFMGSASMSGVNIGTQVTFLLPNIVFGLCAGATVLIGQYLGSNEREKLKETISTLFTFLIIAAIVLSGLMLLFRNQILSLIQTPAEAYSEAMNYLIITTSGTIFTFGYNAFSAVMRGMGDSKRPLVFVTIANITNILLDLVFIGIFRLGAAGTAATTVIAQALSMILCIIYLKRNGFIFDFNIKSFRIYKDRFTVLMKIGIPTSIQNVITNISFMILTTMVNTLGVTASAAVGAVGKLNMFAILPAIAISSSISAMSAQNIGAGEYKRAGKTMKAGMVLAFIMSMAVFILVRTFPEQLLRIFGNDPELIANGVEYIKYFSFDYIFAPLMFAFNGLFIGSGHTFFSLINNMLSAILIRVPVAYLFGMVFSMGLGGIGMGGPFASCVALIVCIIYYLSGKWKKSTIVKHVIFEDN